MTIKNEGGVSITVEYALSVIIIFASANMHRERQMEGWRQG